VIDLYGSDRKFCSRLITNPGLEAGAIKDAKFHGALAQIKGIVSEPRSFIVNFPKSHYDKVLGLF
jgi:hypothetical protein